MIGVHGPGPDGETDEAAVEAELALLMEKALTLRDVADALGLSLKQVQAHVDDGSLVAVNVGRGDVRRDLRVLPDDLAGFLARRRTGASSVAPFPNAVGRRPVPLPARPSYSQRRAARLEGRNA